MIDYFKISENVQKREFPHEQDTTISINMSKFTNKSLSTVILINNAASFVVKTVSLNLQNLLRRNVRYYLGEDHA